MSLSCNFSPMLAGATIIWSLDWRWNVHFQDDSFTCLAVGCWLLVGGFSSSPQGCLSILNAWQLASPIWVIQEKGGSCNAFYVLALEATASSTVFCWLRHLKKSAHVLGERTPTLPPDGGVSKIHCKKSVWGEIYIIAAIWGKYNLP